MARLSSELVLSLTDRVSGPARGVERSLNRLEGQTRRTSRMTAADAGRMGTAQKMALAGVSGVVAPVAAGLGAREVITQAADFESALTNIQKKSGASAAQTAKLGEEIKALVTSGELAVPIEEIAAAYERGAAAGIPLDELRQFASLSAKAADAFEMSAIDVGNAAAGFNKVLGVPMKGMERYFDLINGLADAGIADEEDIVRFVDQAGAMGKTFGLSAEETAAFGAALANLKVPAAKGATAMNSILTRLQAPNALSDDARIAYYKLIKDDKRFKKQLESGDADKAFVEVLDALRAMDKETRTGTILELFGQDHLDVMTQLVEGADEVKRNLAYAGGTDWFGSLEKSYQLKLDDMWSQWQLLKNQMSTLAIDLGTMGMPAFKAGLQGAVDLVKGIQDGMKQMEMEIDWTAIDEAQAAVGALGEQLRSVLQIDTSGSTLKTFFTEVSGIVNDIAKATEWAAKEFKDIVEFSQDPIGFIKKDRSPQEMKDRFGITVFSPEERERRTKEQRAREDAVVEDDRDRSLTDFARGDGFATEPSLQAERGGRFARPVPAFAPAMPAPIRVPTFGAPPLPTARPDYTPSVTTPTPIKIPVSLDASAAEAELARLDTQINELSRTADDVSVAARIAPSPIALANMRAVGDEMERLIKRRAAVEAAMVMPVVAPATSAKGRAVAVPAVPIPTPRPDIVGPITAEGEAAALKAQEIGNRISTAFAVSATATVNMNDSAIDASQRKLDRYLASLARVGPAARSAAESANAAVRSAGRIDMDGIHADIED